MQADTYNEQVNLSHYPSGWEGLLLLEIV